MKTLLTAKILSVLLLSAAVRAETIHVNAGRNDVVVHLPADHVAGTALPLVVLLHGLGADGERQENGGTLDLIGIDAHGMKFAPNVDDLQFILALPDGRSQGLLRPHLHWNATDACCSFSAPNADDGAYIISLIDAIAENDQIAANPSEVYLVGHSNGGFLAHQIACRFSERITAIVSFAGTTFLDPEDCRADAVDQAVHVLHIHGDSDLVVSYNGGTTLGVIPATAPYPGALMTIKNWANVMERSGDCEQVVTPVEVLLDTPLVEGNVDVEVHQYDCEQADASVVHWKLADVGHLPVFSSEFSAIVLKYLFDL